MVMVGATKAWEAKTACCLCSASRLVAVVAPGVGAGTIVGLVGGLVVLEQLQAEQGELVEWRAAQA